MLSRRLVAESEDEGAKVPWRVAVSRSVLRRRRVEVDAGDCEVESVGEVVRIESRRRVRSIMSLKKATASSSLAPKTAFASSRRRDCVGGGGMRPVGWKGTGRSFSEGLLEEELVLG